MYLATIVKILLLLAIVMYFIYKNRAVLYRRRKNNTFYSIYTDNQNVLIMQPSAGIDWFEDVKSRYTWENFNEYDNLFYEYMYNLFDPLPKLAMNQQRSEVDIFRDCTHGQKLFWSVLAFTGDIDGGGAFQFFWNRPEFAFAIVEVFDELKMYKLKEDYLQCLDEITGVKNSISSKDVIRHDLFDRKDGSTKTYSQLVSRYKNVGRMDYFYGMDFKRDFFRTVIEYIDCNKSEFITV